MKRILTTFAIVLLLIGTGRLLSINLSIRSDVKSNIRIAQEKYGGTPEEALIAYLIDESNSKTDRTSIAVWTLGQIESRKALPVLKEFYRNDPEGEFCYGYKESSSDALSGFFIVIDNGNGINTYLLFNN